MCGEEFYNELTAGGGQYRYNTPSTPVLPAPKYMVTFVVAPADMTNVVITVNGEPVEENAELEAGIYTVTVAADNCETVNKEITITADRATHTQKLELRYLDADYSKVDAAIAKAEVLNKNEYKDFTKVEEAVNAVVRGKNITEQTEVDAMAKAIEDAIAALERKPAKSTPTATAKPVTVSAQAETVKETAAVSSVIPQTGDNWNRELYISLFVLSGLALAGTAVLKNRKQHK